MGIPSSLAPFHCNHGISSEALSGVVLLLVTVLLMVLVLVTFEVKRLEKF